MFDSPGTLKQRIEKSEIKTQTLEQSSYHRISASAEIGRCVAAHAGGVDLFDITSGGFKFLTRISGKGFGCWFNH